MSQIENLITQKACIKVNPDDFKTIILDDNNLQELTPADKAYLECFKQLTTLSLSNTHLKSLYNLPQLPNLLNLDLSSNCLLSKDLTSIPNNYPRLETLKLGNNFIKNDWEQLKVPLTKLGESLLKLDLSANPISEGKNTYYREYMFEFLPLLEVLDGYDKDNKEVYSSDEEDENERIRRGNGQMKKSSLKNANQRYYQDNQNISNNGEPVKPAMVNLDNEESKDFEEDDEEEKGEQEDEDDEDQDDGDDEEEDEPQDEEEIEGYYAEEDDGDDKNDKADGDEDADEDEDDEEEEDEDVDVSLGKRMAGVSGGPNNKMQRIS